MTRLPGLLTLALLLAAHSPAQTANASSAVPLPKTFLDYFLPVPIASALTSQVWGAATVGPRDPANGLEDRTMKRWDYWDGKIIKGKDGKYHLFASRWDQSKNNVWWGSKAIHAVSDKATGPYVDKGLCWPDDRGGQGHNVTALVLPDGRYAIMVSETRPGDVFVSKSPNGPWQNVGSIQLAKNEFSEGEKMSTVSIMVRPDGSFEIVPAPAKSESARPEFWGHIPFRAPAFTARSLSWQATIRVISRIPPSGSAAASIICS